MLANVPDRLSDYAGLLGIMGHKVVRVDNSLWYSVRRRIYQSAFPFHQEDNQAAQARAIVNRGGVLACRWFTRPQKLGPEHPIGPVVFVARPPYDLTRLQAKARNQTRRGLERLKVRRDVFTKAIENQAFVVYADNVHRLGLFRHESQRNKRWSQWVNALRASPALDFWGAWQEQALVAYTVTARTPWGLEILCQRSLASALNLYPNNALVFLIVNAAFEQGEPLVSYGLGEFTGGQSGLDHFKKGMAFDETPLQEHFCWHSALRIFSPLLKARSLRAIAHLFNSRAKPVSPARMELKKK